MSTASAPASSSRPTATSSPTTTSIDGATQIKVTLNDRRVLNAKLIGTDKLTDIAVVKIDAKNLPSIAWGDSAKLHPGQTVLAFGSPFGSLQFSVTRGIVSALNRPNIFR